MWLSVTGCAAAAVSVVVARDGEAVAGGGEELLM